MAILDWTVRDFAKAKEGKEFLRQHFDFSKFPAPKLGSPVELFKGCDAAVVGTAFDILLPLLICRQNKLKIDPEAQRLYWLSTKELRTFNKSIELPETFLNLAIKRAFESHRSFSWATKSPRSRSNQSLREALRLLSKLAGSIKWETVNVSRASLGTFASLDLLLDRTAVEVKTVKDAGHHSEHTAQLISYHLLSRLPSVKKEGVVIDSIGVYYARHGVLTTTSIDDLRRSEKEDLDAVAAKLYESFIRWAVNKRYADYDSPFKATFLKNQLKLGLFSAGLRPGANIRQTRTSRSKARSE